MAIKEYISKRIAGAICLTVGLGMSIASGFSTYNVEGVVIATVFGTGTALLGIDAYKQVVTRNS